MTTASSVKTDSPAIEFPSQWKRRHLLDLESLTAEEITTLLDTAQNLKVLTHNCKNKVPLLVGKTCANLFFENSTRTRNSFSLAAKRLGADTVEFSSSGSSVAKGETFVDTAKPLKRWAWIGLSLGTALPAHHISFLESSDAVFSMREMGHTIIPPRDSSIC